ncbi:Ndufb11, NADH dehydrogenase 1 beta subcomplex [Trichosporon asahii var. asahii CBS 8904]|uniref:NADH dehydrogenase [ubiquinone] 1 beta subcomplex subunit 11, mitochondrial n=1 Tax=Trichosporon asahii var. asahii (strain CBS 8904) TaxID=1220162 RepID=K1VFY2_TRIAC|nr:Ndufb11, NADH dehydrogenase 1 beta subcomplex [Trichosporon asahii var. asahii CBS 8904]
MESGLSEVECTCATLVVARHSHRVVAQILRSRRSPMRAKLISLLELTPDPQGPEAPTRVVGHVWIESRTPQRASARCTAARRRSCASPNCDPCHLDKDGCCGADIFRSRHAVTVPRSMLRHDKRGSSLFVVARSRRWDQLRLQGAVNHTRLPLEVIDCYPHDDVYGLFVSRKADHHRTLFYVGMFGGMALATVVYIYKPDTSIQTWALQEAKARMDARGEKYEYNKPPQ